jgi:predicted ATPase
MASALRQISLLRDSVADWEQYPFTVDVIRHFVVLCG